jgi:hypothetical protein
MKTNIGTAMLFAGAIALMTLRGAARASAAEFRRWQTSAQL